jgi:hypothetical protein
MTNRAAWLAVVVLAVSPASEAQEKPDFSGQWELVVAAGASSAGVAPRITIRQPIVRTNALGAPMKPSFATLTVERIFADRVTTETFQIGVDGGTIGGGGFRTSFSVRWEEHQLVMVNSAYSGPGSADLTTEHKEVWELAPDGTLIISATEFEVGHDSTSKRLTYRRK